MTSNAWSHVSEECQAYKIKVEGWLPGPGVEGSGEICSKWGRLVTGDSTLLYKMSPLPPSPPPPWIFPLVVIFMVRTAIINSTEDKGVAWLVQMGKSCRFCKGNSDPYELKTIWTLLNLIHTIKNQAASIIACAGCPHHLPKSPNCSPGFSHHLPHEI
jgi:hypothetical protein